MNSIKKAKLFSKVLLIGLVIAILSYLFHPEVGQLKILINGQPVADPLIRFAAIPTFLIFIGFSIILIILMAMGFGIILLLGCVFVIFILSVFAAPYFWPVLAFVFLFIGLLSIR